MRTTWIAGDEIISPLGMNTRENYEAVRNLKSGISLVSDSNILPESFYAGRIMNLPAPGDSRFTRFENMVIRSISGAIGKTSLDPSASNVIFILSTTKGNIDLIDQPDVGRISLPQTAKLISDYFQNPNTPLIVSNACVSGVAAIILGKRLIETGAFDHAVVTGADILSRFVVSGFQSLRALSPEPCRPFDRKRNGTTLGEAAATVVLTANPSQLGAEKVIEVLGSGQSNDANHISGPSRTGDELSFAVERAMHESGIGRMDIDFISAHGTATVFNDEMEAKAFHTSGLSNTPLNSLKGYFGHTLGAAGVVESVISLHALLRNELIPTLGFEESGVSAPVSISNRLESRKLTTCLKTASGFGGCNAAMILRKAS